MTADRRILLVDASAFITRARIGAADLLAELDGDVRIPATVADEIASEPSTGVLAEADWITIDGIVQSPTSDAEAARERAERYLARDSAELDGDLALLTAALLYSDGIEDGDVVVISDDRPLRQTCKAVSIPISGSIGVLIRAVERDVFAADEARDKLYAMDEVGARLSASLVRRAERLIEDADSD